MLPQPTDLATVSDFKEEQNVSGTADDARIQKLITRATAWIENATNRKFVARRYNGATASAPDNTHPTTGVLDEDYHYFDGDPSQVDARGMGLYYLPQYPVQANSVLTFQLATLSEREDVSGDGDTWDTTALVEGRDYIVDRTLGAIRLLGGTFTQGQKNYRVKYAAGYALTQAPWVPADLQGLCIEMAAGIFNDDRTVTSESIGTWSRSFDKQRDDPFVSQVLSNYTRFVL